MNILVTICGRAGSKGVKNKNMREFLGTPLVHYTVSAAFLFKFNNPNYTIDICLNSDSEDLLEMFADRNDIHCITRPIELAQDHSPKVPVIHYSLTWMEDKLSIEYDYVIDLDITSPLRKTEDLENALNKAIDNPQTDVVFSVVHSRRNPYFNMVQNKDGVIQRIIHSDFVARQQAPHVYDMNASVYCYRKDSLLEVLHNSPLDGKYDITLMKDTAVLDIDSEEDFELMELLAEHFFKGEFNELYNYVNSLDLS